MPETVQTQDRPDLPQSAGATAQLLLQTLRREGVPLGPDDLAARFSGQPRRRIEFRISQTLVILAMAGAVHSVEDGWFTPRRPDP